MGFFGNLFGKKQLSEPVDLSVLKVDFHSHLIPGIDDGVDSVEEAVDVIRKFKELGYQKVITTPHVMSDYYKNSSETILAGLEKVRERVEQEKIGIVIEAAAEYYADEYLEELIAKKDLLTFGDNYVLFELSFLMEPPNLAKIIFDLQMAGYKPVLAHPERYGFWFKSMEHYHDLKNKGVMLQMNLLSVTGHYSPDVQKTAEKMIKEKLVDFAGSDCHKLHHLHILEQNLKKPSFEGLLDLARNSELL